MPKMEEETDKLSANSEMATMNSKQDNEKSLHDKIVQCRKKGKIGQYDKFGKIGKMRLRCMQRQRTSNYINKLETIIHKQKNIIKCLKFKLEQAESELKPNLPGDGNDSNTMGWLKSSIDPDDVYVEISYDGANKDVQKKDGIMEDDVQKSEEENMYVHNNVEVQLVESDTVEVSADMTANTEKAGEVNEDVKRIVEDFMNREDISIVDVAMNYLRSGGKIARFRRSFLCVLYHQFRAEVYSSYSFQEFCKYIPESVIKPEPTFWKVIQCSKCENAELKFTEVVTKILQRNDILLEEILVSHELYEEVCNELGKLKTSSEPFTYMTWAKTLLGRMEASENIVTTTVGSACADLLKELDLLKEHMNRCYTQYEAVREAREEVEISPIHTLVHIDWYENPATFVARHLHTAYYCGDGFKTLHAGYVRTKEKSYGIASLSDSRNHTASAVWASINDELVNLANQGMKVITIVSDSGTGQYRNKSIFYLMRRFARQNKVEMKWIFLEAGHGKGIADSVGAKVKDVICKTVVKYKDKSFRNTYDFIPIIKSLTDVRVSSHTENLIQQYKNLINRQQVQGVPNTYKIHEVCVKETTFYVKESSADKLPFFSFDTKVKGISV